jgi:dissimilatory sulfite reductase related protein
MPEQENVSPAGERIRSIAGKEVLFDKDGFFVDIRDWDEQTALILSRELGVGAMSEKQWVVIGFLREYFLSNGKAPLNSELKAGTGLSIMELESMFPGGVRQGARLLAGLPNPKSCTS